MARHAGAIQTEMMICWAGVTDHHVNGILDPVRLLVVAMLRTALAQGETRQERWQHVMGALVDLVRHESIELRISGAQRS